MAAIKSNELVTLDIVELIENNPVTRLNGVYQNKMLQRIKEKFTEDEQKMFVTSFYCYLNYNQKTDFIIDLDNVWKWVGFSNKAHSKNLLEREFILDKDYIKLLTKPRKQDSLVHGGHNKETFMLNVHTFKRFCLKAGTKKAEQIHEYYINLEETLQEVIEEESNELRLQIENKSLELANKSLELANEKIDSVNAKEKIREKTLLEQFPNNTQCVYYGIIDNTFGDKKEKLIKFGNSNHLKNRVTKHRDTYLNFRLVNAFKVDNKLQIENAIKENSLFTKRIRSITLKNKKYIEILNIDGISFAELDKTIKEIIANIEYSPENYVKLLEENKMLKKHLMIANDVNNTNEVILLTSENKSLKCENIHLVTKYNKLKKRLKINEDDDNKKYNYIDDVVDVIDIDVDNTDDEIKHNILVQKTCENYNEIIHDLKSKNAKKNKNGKYDFNGKVYDLLIGTREEVWYEYAYKTSGYLVKSDLLMNKSGKIISKRKCIHETNMKRFEMHGINKKNE